MHKKILIAMLIVVALPLISLWYTNNYKLRQEVELQVSQDLVQTTHQLADKINEWNDTNVRMLDQNSKLAAIQSGEEAQQKPVLASIVSSYDWTYLAYGLDADGYRTARSDDEVLIKPDGTRDYRGDRIYFKQIQAGNPVGSQVLISNTLDTPAIILCHGIEVQDKLSFGKKPILCIGMTVNKLSDTVVNTKIGKTGYAILLDETNKVIAHGKPEVLKEKVRDMSDDTALLHAVDSRGDKPYFYTNNKVQKIAYSETVANNWRLIVEQDYDDAFSPVIKATREALIFLVITIILTIVVSYFMAKRLAKPIQRLTGIADDISRGTFHNKIDESARSDEIGELAKAIERMSISISIAFRKLKAKK